MPEKPIALPWFIPTPDVLPPQRATLRLGMGRSERYFREVVVPGIGGVSFVRQLSWAIAGVTLGSSVPRRQPSRIANGIEALACKLNQGEAASDGRLRGVRAFARSPDTFAFADLSQRKYYVQVTYRQGTVGALLSSGLGFTEQSQRFNAMACTRHGVDLAEAFLGQSQVRRQQSLRAVLLDWARGDAVPDLDHRRLAEAISPGRPTPAEQRIVRERLESIAAQVPHGVPLKRRLQLVELLRGRSSEPTYASIVKRLDEVGKRQLDLALVFAQLAASARDVVRAAAIGLNAAPRALASKLADDKTVAESLRVLRDRSRDYLRAAPQTGLEDAGADAIARSGDLDNPGARLISVVGHDGIGLACDDGKSVRQGPRYDIVLRNAREGDATADDSDESDTGIVADETGLRLSRLRQLWILLQDCNDASR